MTRQDAINRAFQIKEASSYEGFDLSADLYGAVGLIKQEKDYGATFAAMQLVEAIKNTGVKLSDFCKRKIAIIEKADIERGCRFMTMIADAYEAADIAREEQFWQEQEMSMIRDEYSGKEKGR